MKKFAVCFKGGFAKGAGSIGMVRFLQEEGLKPTVFSGSSAGSMISAAYALNMQWDEILTGFKSTRVMDLIDIRNILQFKSLISTRNLKRALIKFGGEEIADLKIEDMPNQFVALASNLKTESLEYITEGKLINALMYSSGYPGLIEKPNKYLIDGDILFDYSNNFFKHKGAEVVIGCRFDLNKKLYKSTNPIKVFIDTYRLVQYKFYNLSNVAHKADYEIVYDASKVGFTDLEHCDYLVDKVYNYLKKHKKEFYTILGE